MDAIALDGEPSVCHVVLSLGWSGLHFKKSTILTLTPSTCPGGVALNFNENFDW
jgi:hypothetical protein